MSLIIFFGLIALAIYYGIRYVGKLSQNDPDRGEK